MSKSDPTRSQEPNWVKKHGECRDVYIIPNYLINAQPSSSCRDSHDSHSRVLNHQWNLLAVVFECVQYVVCYPMFRQQVRSRLLVPLLIWRQNVQVSCFELTQFNTNGGIRISRRSQRPKSSWTGLWTCWKYFNQNHGLLLNLLNIHQFLMTSIQAIQRSLQYKI